MKVKLPVMIQDQTVARGKGTKLAEMIHVEESFFLDGPVSERVAVLDFGEDGRLAPLLRFQPPADPKNAGYYVGAGSTGVDIHSPAFIQASVLGTVLGTMHMFEEEDTLGRQVSWAFDAPQLLIVPRAGEWENAFYERDSHSLQLFSFKSQRKEYDDAGVERPMIHTCLSHDIISHETAHAVLDGIAPDLYHSILPQSLALHEAIADLTALIMAFRSRPLREAVLDQTGGLIDESTAFSSIAEEFGVERQRLGPLRPLRSLLNDRKMPADSARRISPHELSEVLSGALYTVMVEMHEMRKCRYAKESKTPYEVSGKALVDSGRQFKRMSLRALDYLPPGEVSFADYGRAILAADAASHPDSGDERGWIAEEFERRGIVPDAECLHPDPALESSIAELNRALRKVDLDTLIKSDWAAYDFANKHRDLLQIPADRPFNVRPRLDVTKAYWHGKKDDRYDSECLFKVSWEIDEDNPARRGLPSKRRITVGTTLAIDRTTGTVRALLTSDTNPDLKIERDAMITRLADEGRLAIGTAAIGPDGKPLRSVVQAEISGNLLRIQNSARMLHIEGLELTEEANDD
jgi:hypothetical protein